MALPKKGPKPPMVEHGFAAERERDRKLKATIFAMILAVGVEIARIYGLDLPAHLSALLVGSGGAYVMGEGLADFGKRRHG